jgi:hypothetical protein
MLANHALFPAQECGCRTAALSVNRSGKRKMMAGGSAPQNGKAE